MRTCLEAAAAAEKRQLSIAATSSGEKPPSPGDIENLRESMVEPSPSRPTSAQLNSVSSASFVQSTPADPVLLILKEDMLKSITVETQSTPSHKEGISSSNISTNSSPKKLNPVAPEFTYSHQSKIPLLQVLLSISAPHQFLSKDDTERQPPYPSIKNQNGVGTGLIHLNGFHNPLTTPGGPLPEENVFNHLAVVEQVPGGPRIAAADGHVPQPPSLALAAPLAVQAGENPPPPEANAGGVRAPDGNGSFRRRPCRSSTP
ncbi:OLC1v1024109C1 [Oldenlandia corymbosa var. corymbosa]|uniref:OLC1v1024109C1 n=1 Tax=Oldenlandia corymbosa var. corymbosa TaxID=529605 RepID=A0AAV1C512_OLDCO|nr:OLC1v1024109C1 [Oldenlandia corymbosa var. corymbosa]